jgi:hypothetical protein
MDHSGYSMRNLKNVLEHEGYRGLYRGKFCLKYIFNDLAGISVNLTYSFICRLFCISLLHPPLSYYILPTLRTVQDIFQLEIRMET